MNKLSNLFFFCFIFFVGIVFSAKAERYVRTPLGYVWSSCLHHMDRGSHIVHGEDELVRVISPSGFVKTLPKCPKPTLPRHSSNPNKAHKISRDSPDDGWQVWSAYLNQNNATFTSFLGNFNVPSAPSNWDGGILYMFTGLQNYNWIPYPDGGDAPPGFDIIQPVLQYGGDSEDGGGNYWELASWYVTVDSGAVWSTPEIVNPGDVIFGNMTKTGPSTWFIGGTVHSTGVSSTFSVTYPRLSSQPWAYCTLEVYDIDDCAGDFFSSSSPLKFTDFALYQGKMQPVTPQWQGLNNGANNCGTTITINSPQEVTIVFGNN